MALKVLGFLSILVLISHLHVLSLARILKSEKKKTMGSQNMTSLAVSNLPFATTNINTSNYHAIEKIRLDTISDKTSRDKRKSHAGFFISLDVEMDKIAENASFTSPYPSLNIDLKLWRFIRLLFGV